MIEKYHVCPACGSHRLKALTRRGSYYCPKCDKKYLISEERIDACFKCGRQLVDPAAEAELMGSGKFKCRRCRTKKMREEVMAHG
ncbi:MAG: hypothetical protein ACHQ0Y_04875 [Thermodesulfovibrionales bacterium]